jgi:hypothetical protein
MWGLVTWKPPHFLGEPPIHGLQDEQPHRRVPARAEAAAALHPRLGVVVFASAVMAGRALPDHDTPIWDDGGMETPAEGLARLERMGQRARERRAKAEAEERAQQDVYDAEWARQSLQDGVPAFLAGPPDGCTACYAFRWMYTGVLAWQWWHTFVVNLEVRPAPAWDGDDPTPVEHCMCRCHGPEGLPLFPIAFA